MVNYKGTLKYYSKKKVLVVVPDESDWSDVGEGGGGDAARYPDLAGVWLPVYDGDEAAHHAFTATPGLVGALPEDSPPMAYVEQFVTDGLLDLMVRETNLYAEQYITSHQAHLQSKPRSRVHKWIRQGATHREEMKAFLGIWINMGLIRKPSIKSYWDTCHDSQRTPWFNEHFGRDRFLLMLKFLHFVNNDEQPELGHPDRQLFKVAPLVEHFNTTFSSCYVPSKDIVIDESMVGFRGRTPNLRRYLPNKRHSRFGVKIWCLADSSNGYLHTFEVCQGTSDADRRAPNGPIHTLVIRLMQKSGLQGQGFHLTLDNFFTSPKLSQELHALGTTSTGTVRSNRKGLPRAAITAPLLNKAFLERRKGPLLCTVYQDGRKRPVLLSTEATAGSSHVTNRRGQVLRKPKTVLQYNKTMGGVDLADQQLYMYLAERRTLKWTTKVAISLIGRAMVNAYLLYKGNSPPARRLSRHLFFAAVAEAFVGNYRPQAVPRRRRSRAQMEASAAAPILPPSLPPREPSPWDIFVGHDLVHVPGTRRRDCVGHHPDRVRTRWQCSGCDLGMCPGCFMQCHRRRF